MRLELKPINDAHIDLFSTLTTKYVGSILLDKGEWVFRPHDCGCAWTTEVVFELGRIMENMNK